MQQAPTIFEDQFLPAPIQASRGFEFPKDCHLLITTSTHVYAWDYSSIHSIFHSNKHGIVAAREAPNGSGVLAVADKHVVVLHDTKRGQEKSWGLAGDADKVRQLEYTADAKSLYLSTSLTSDIQRYSTELSRLLDPARSHASPPVALALSPTGRLMVSASDCPPVVYLRNLKTNSSPTLIEPRASQTAVTVASFHPERPNVFLLAFRDGTVAAYDAARMIRSGADSVSHQEDVCKGEVCRLASLHRASSAASRRVAITGAAFLPGFKWRAVTVGNDGRCRIVDFANGGVTLRTWHAKVPVTSVSVLALKSDARARKRSTGSIAAHVIGGPTNTDSLIAIGRVDGEVLIYDSVGLLLSQRDVSETKERIISVEWIKAPSPEPIGLTRVETTVGDASQAAKRTETRPKVTAQCCALETNVSSTPTVTPTSESNGSPSKHQTARTSFPKGSTPSSDPPRRFTTHPDETGVQDGTVRRTPVSRLQQIPRIVTEDFRDLFSPSETVYEKPDMDISPGGVGTPLRSRPTITSQTFVKSPDPGDPAQYDVMTRRRNLALFPSTESKPETTRPTKSADAYAERPQTGLNVSSLTKSTKQATSKVNSTHPAHKHTRFKYGSDRPHPNGKVSLDLLLSNSLGFDSPPTSALSGYDLTNLNPDRLIFGVPARKKSRTKFFHCSPDHIETDADSEIAREAYEHIHTKYNWPEDSNQESSVSGDGVMSSVRNPQATGLQAPRSGSMKRPLARRTPRFQGNLKSTISTAGRQSAKGPAELAQPLQKIDGSTDEDVFITADTHVTSSGMFSPSSKDVYELFPRSSSLSPRKCRRSKTSASPKIGLSTGHHSHCVPMQAYEIPLKSPWARARVLRTMEIGKDESNITAIQRDNTGGEGATATDEQAGKATDSHCIDCRTLHAKVLELEAGVSRLEAEVLAIKAMLKRCRITPREASRARLNS